MQLVLFVCFQKAMKNESHICVYFNFILWCLQTDDFERLTDVSGFDPCLHILVAAFAQAIALG